jgi:serine/threonine protein phosphatase PrpC
MSLELRVWAGTSVGCVRRANEDALCIGPLVVAGELAWYGTARLDARSSQLVAVVDGMGGHRGGADASLLVARLLAEVEPGTLPTFETAQDMLASINTRLHASSIERPELCGMGATVAAIWFGTDGGLCLNVGDAKVFRQQDGFLELRSDDHVFEYPDRRRALTQSLGGNANLLRLQPSIRMERSRTGRRYLLCTDGLTDDLGMDQLERLMLLPPDQAVPAMVDEARTLGGRDNITAAVVEIQMGALP